MVIDLTKKAEPNSAITFLYLGHGPMDLASYVTYFKGGLKNFELHQERLLSNSQGLPRNLNTTQAIEVTFQPFFCSYCCIFNFSLSPMIRA